MGPIRFIVYLFPVLTIAALFYFFVWYWQATRTPLAAPGSSGSVPRRRFTFAGKCHPMARRDALPLLVITTLYALTAFAQLGSMKAPQSALDLGGTESHTIVLPQEVYVANLWYFPNLGTGEYNLEISADGAHWSTLWSRTDESGSVTSYYWADAAGYEPSYAMSQNYNQLFKWIELAPENPQYVRYLRLTGRSDKGLLELGELALFDHNGTRVSTNDSAEPLLDEQDTVPDAISWFNSAYFDEIYHPRTALEHIEGVSPYEISHPPLGKLILGLGIRLFGMTPFGWRFMGTLFGVLMLPILYDFIKRLSGSTRISICGTVIFAFDFMHFVQTRIATIDTYSVFFILLMYLFMWRFVSGGKWRYLALSGLFFGLGAASKWTCIYAGGGLAVIWLAHWISRRRDEGFWRDFISNCAFCLVFFVAVPAAIYYVSYYYYGTAKGLEGGLGMFFTKDYADIVWHNQVYMWEYHSDLVSTHPYSSRWYQWLVDARPILYYLEYFDDGTKSAFGAFLNPVFCWGGLLAVIGCGILAIKDRDSRAAFIVIGYLAQLLPWVLVTRLTFAYHYFPSEVFMLLALCHMWRRCRDEGLYKWYRPMYAFTGLCVVLFAAFYPVLTGIKTPVWYTRSFLKWFPSWPF